MADSDGYPVDPLDRILPPQATPGADFDEGYIPSQYEEIDLKLRQEELKNAVNNNKLREELPNRLWFLTISWLGSVVAIMLFSGIQHADFPGFFFLKYDPSVLIALITSATASVLGLLIILLNYLYPKDGINISPGTGNRANRSK
jgi:hypothetical protein